MKRSKKRKKTKKGLYPVSFVRISFYLSVIVIVLLAVTYVVKPFKGENERCANSVSCISDLSGEYDESSQLGTFEGKTVAVPPYVAYNPSALVLGENAGSNKRIYIDLTNQKLTAHEGETVVYEFPVSSGKPWWPTPTGDFRIWIKLRYTRMTGGSKEGGDYYSVPNVPYTMYFYNDKIPKYRGYGVHGAYWHNNFGNPMSHGCVNLRPEDAEKLYYWTTPAPDKATTYANDDNPGTLITISGVTPRR